VKVKKKVICLKKLYILQLQKEKKALNESLIDFLGSTDLDAVKFNIAAIMLCHINKDEVIKTLTNRRIQLEVYFKGITYQLNELTANPFIPSLGLLAIKHNLYLIEAELKTTNELVIEVQGNTSWDNFIAKQISN
jgi:hypothetical protein